MDQNRPRALLDKDAQRGEGLLGGSLEGAGAGRSQVEGSSVARQLRLLDPTWAAATHEAVAAAIHELGLREKQVLVLRAKRALLRHALCQATAASPLPPIFSAPLPADAGRAGAGLHAGGQLEARLELGCVVRLMEEVYGAVDSTTVQYEKELSAMQCSGAALCIALGGSSETIGVSVLTTYYLQLATCYLLLATCFLPLATCYLLLATGYLLPTTYDSLLATPYTLHTTHELLIATYYPLLTTHYSLLTTYDSLLTTHHTLLTTYYLLLTIHYRR